jgi:hypothetical protein
MIGDDRPFDPTRQTATRPLDALARVVDVRAAARSEYIRRRRTATERAVCRSDNDGEYPENPRSLPPARSPVPTTAMGVRGSSVGGHDDVVVDESALLACVDGALALTSWLTVR